MNKNTFKRLGLVVLSFATLLVMGGCGGGGSSTTTTDTTTTTTTTTTAKATVSGTVSFPSLGALVGKQAVGKLVAAAVPTTFTVSLLKLDGTVVVSKIVSGTSYSFENIDVDDYIIKVVAGTGTDQQVLRALVDKGSISDATTRNIDTVSTTTVIVAEKKMGAAVGTLGEAGNTKTSADIAAVNPVVLEAKISTAINNGVTTTTTKENIDIVNLVNVVAATVYNKVDTTSYVAGTSTATVTTTQFTAGTAAGTSTTVAAATVATTLTTTASSYTAPPAGTFAFTSRVMDSMNSPATALSGVAVTTSGLSSVITTYTDANGFYTITGIPKDTKFIIKMSKTGYADSYSAQHTLNANSDTSDRPYDVWTPTKLTTNWGNTSGTGVIRSRVVENTDLVSGYMGGVVVTATDAADSAITYPVIYLKQSTNTWDSTLTSTDTNGNWMLKNVPAGKTVNVTASKSGFTFNTRTFVVVADSVCEGRITGTAVVSANATKDALIAGFYGFNQQYVSGTGTTGGTNYYTVRRNSLSADGVTLTETTAYYYDRATKAWTVTAPVGFPTNNSDYTLTATGWKLDGNGPNGYNIVFNADGTARVTNPVTGSVMDVKVAEVNISGLDVLKTLINQNHSNNPPLLSTVPVFPTGSKRYDLTVTNLAESYTVWGSSSMGSSSITTLTQIPALYSPYVTGSTTPTGWQMKIDSMSNTDYYYAQFASGSTTDLNIYLRSNSTTTTTSAPVLIGTATASIKTVMGNAILEIDIPAATKSAYLMTGNPIFAVVNGVVMEGRHESAGVSADKGGSSFNDVAINHVKNYIDTALAKQVVAKKLSKAILGW